MGSLRLTVCTGILAVAAFAPAAHAADSSSVSVTPAAPAPGTDVSVRVHGCSGPQGTAASAAFVTDARLTGAQGTLAGETRVRSSLKPGAYDVRITCADYVITGKITVVDRGTAPGQAAGQYQDPAGRPATPASPASPVAPVPAGGGGTAHFATVATTESGPDTVQTVTGLALAATAAVAVGLRARRKRGTR